MKKFADNDKTDSVKLGSGPYSQDYTSVSAHNYNLKKALKPEETMEQLKARNSADHTHLDNPDRSVTMQTVNNFYDKNALVLKSANNVAIQQYQGNNQAYDMFKNRVHINNVKLGSVMPEH